MNHAIQLYQKNESAKLIAENVKQFSRIINNLFCLKEIMKMDVRY